MRKKGILSEALVRIIIAVVAVSFVISIGWSYFRLTNSAEKSFNDFVDKIEESSKWQENFQSVRLQMDEGTAIYGFGKNSEAIERWDLNRNPVTKTFIVGRFDSCEDGKTCVCLCKERKLVKYGPSSGTKDQTPGNETCEDFICDSIEGIDFQQTTSKMKLLLKGTERPRGLVADIEVRGGFVFYRHAIDQGPVFAIDLLQQWALGPRQRAVYLEKGPDNTLGVCLELPCI